MFFKKMTMIAACAMCLVSAEAFADGHHGGHNNYNHGYGHHNSGNNWQVPAIVGGTVLGLGVAAMIMNDREAPRTEYYYAPAPLYVPAPTYYVAPQCQPYSQTVYTPEGYAYNVTREMCAGSDGVWRLVR